MPTDLPTLIKITVGDDPNAFAEILVAFHGDLRTWLAGFAINKALVDAAE